MIFPSVFKSVVILVALESLLFASQAIAQQHDELEFSKGDIVTLDLRGDVATIIKDQLLQLEMRNSGGKSDRFVKAQAKVVQLAGTSAKLRAVIFNGKEKGNARMVAVDAVVPRSQINKSTPANSRKQPAASRPVVRIDSLSDVQIEVWNRVQTIKLPLLTSHE